MSGEASAAASPISRTPSPASRTLSRKFEETVEALLIPLLHEVSMSDCPDNHPALR
jgi:hypothetical protein